MTLKLKFNEKLLAYEQEKLRTDNQANGEKDPCVRNVVLSENAASGGPHSCPIMT